MTGGGGCRSHAQQAVFSVEDDLLAVGQEVCDEGGRADAEVHVGTFRDVGGDPRSKLLSADARAH